MHTATFHHMLQHHLNALHIYCKLCRIMPVSLAKKVSRAWEKIVHPILYL